MTRQWRHPEFAARVGEEVTLRAADGPHAGQEVPATLATCSDAVRRGDLVSYSVTFVAGPGAPREQTVFLVVASGMAAEPVFLVPRRDIGNHLEYEAVFNQPIDSGSAS